MSSPERYRRALACGREEYEAVLREDEALLRAFGLKMTSTGGGITAAVESELRGGRINPWNLIRFEGRVWEWLHPLLIELQASRHPTSVQDAVLRRVKEERVVQDELWGEQAHPDGTDPELGVVAEGFKETIQELGPYWSAVLLKQSYEACATTSDDALEDELVKVAAVATAWAEAIRRRRTDA